MNRTSPQHAHEIATRRSGATQVRLLRERGTEQLWVEICGSDLDLTLVIPVRPERAWIAFHHPYAYMAAQTPRTSPDLLAA